MSAHHNGRIDRHRFTPTTKNPGALPAWDRVWPKSMRLDCLSSVRDFAAGHEVTDTAVGGRRRPRRWYRVIVEGAPMPRAVSSAWLAVVLHDLKRRGKSGVARRCEAPGPHVDPRPVHLGGLGEGRCGARAFGLRATGNLDAVTCPFCVRDRVASEWLVWLRGVAPAGYLAVAA